MPDARYGRRAIKWLARFGRDPCTLLIVVLAGLGTAHILVRTATYGAEIDGRSILFLSTALNFLAGEGWRDLTGSPLVSWPPLFPLLLAAFGWVGFDPVTAGRWVNATAFGLTLLAAGLYLRSHLRSQWLALAATATLAASLPLSHWAAQLRTETLFALLTLLSLMQLGAFLNRRTDAPLWWAAVFTALAALTRYPGVVLIGGGVFVPLADRLKDTVVFGAISSLPLAGVLTRNWVVSGTLTGSRRGGEPLFDVLSQLANAFRGWVIPPNAPDGLGCLLWLAAGLVLAAGAVAVWSGRSSGMGAQEEGGGNKGTNRTASPLFGLGPALPFGVFAVAYFVFLFAVTPFAISHGIGSRLLLPVYVPLLLTAVFLLDRFLSIKAAGWMVAGRYGLAALVLLGALAHVGFSAHENLRLTTQAYATGYGKTPNKRKIVRWQQSETLNYIRDNHIVGRIYTNWGELAWFWIANKMGWAETEAEVHIFWLDKPYNRAHRGYDDLDLRLLPGIEIVAELSDGVVFRRTAAEPFDEDRHRARKQRYVDQLIQQASEHVGRAGWDVYRTERTLIYRKQPCSSADVQAKFVLHVVPADPADLPVHRQPYGSENLGFYFRWSFYRQSLGFRLGDQCIALAQLPAYDIDLIHIGQWISAENRTLWEAEFAPCR